MLYEALTRHNYFPNQKSNIGELPPCVSSRQFTPEVSEELAKLGESKTRESSGYDVVTYNATRYNNAFRELSLIHPKAYSLLAKHIHDHWDKIEYIKQNKNSIIKPEQHEDGRIMVMNYEDPIEKTTRSLTESFGKKFQVRADISNCFNSIYTHAIVWGLVGFSYAKANRQPQLWFNELDKYQRKCKRNETQGVPIGSATSNVSVEIVLGKIDEELRDSGFHFHRYIDDYSCYCETNEDAHRFVRVLGKALARYKLTLNIRKTDILELPLPDQDSWVLEILCCLPSRLNKGHADEPKLSAPEAITFINNALTTNKQTPDGSVLKYAIQLIINFLADAAYTPVYNAILNLSWHYPILIPYLDTLIDKSNVTRNEIESHLNALIIENSLHRRSDGICWPLHIMKKQGIAPSNKAIDAVMDSEDCVGLAILNSLLIGNQQIIDFSNNIIGSKDNYLIDTYWILLYQLFRDGDVKNAYENIKIFDVLLSHDVNFIPSKILSKAELKCQGIMACYIFGPITAPQELEF